MREQGITIKPYTGDTQSQWGYEETEESLPELSKYLRSYHKTKESSILILIAVLVAVLAIVFTPDLLTPNQKKTIRISLLLLLLAFVGYYLADFGYEKYTAYTAEQKQIALAKADSIARVKAEEAEKQAKIVALEKEKESRVGREKRESVAKEQERVRNEQVQALARAKREQEEERQRKKEKELESIIKKRVEDYVRAYHNADDYIKVEIESETKGRVYFNNIYAKSRYFTCEYWISDGEVHIKYITYVDK